MSSVQDTINIMLDLETLGTRPGCKILSIGAKVFDVERTNFNSALYIRANPDLQAKLHTEVATEDWWAKQDPEVRAEAFGGTEYLHVALTEFVDWISYLKEKLNCKKIRIWCKGASFDAPIMEAAMESYCVPVPWKFWEVYCFRTLYDLGMSLGIEPDVFDGDKHNALHDAINQAAHAEKILMMIRYSVR